MQRIASPELGTWRAVVAEGRVPGPFEADLWIALGHFYREAGSPDDGRVTFGMADLLDLMQQPRGGTTYRLIREGLDRIHAVRCLGYGPDEKAILGKNGKLREPPSVGFHLLDNFDAKDPSRVYVKLNEVICASMGQQGRNLDARLYFTLKTPTARRLYRVLDLRRYRPQRTHALTIPLAELAAEMPLRSTEPRLQKRNLADAHTALIAAGYLGAVSYEQVRRGEWLVTYTFPEIAADAPPVLTAATPAAAADDRVRRRVQELLELLRDHGSTAFYVQVARDLPDPVYDHLVGGVREMRSEGMALDRLRKVFTASARARLQREGARVSPMAPQRPTV